MKYSKKHQPFVSIIVPAYNEEKYIEKTLNSLINQDYSRYEIIIIDDNSKDETLEISKEYAKKYPKKIKVIALSRRNKSEDITIAKPAFPRRIGIEKSKGELIIHFLAHMRASKNLISVFVKELNNFDENVACVGCADELDGENTLSAKIIYILWRKGRRFPRNNCFVENVFTAIYRRDVINKIGGFPLGGDCELNILLNLANYKKYFTTKTRVFYIWHPKSERSPFVAFFKRMVVYGNARAKFLQKYSLPKVKYVLLSLLSFPFGYGVGFLLHFLGIDVRRRFGL